MNQLVSAAAVAVGVLVLMSSSARAQQVERIEVPNAQLQTDVGKATLVQRIEAAVHRVCRPESRAPLFERWQCEHDARRDAMRQASELQARAAISGAGS